MVAALRPDACSIDLRNPADVLDTLRTTGHVQTVILDPWYNKGVGGVREDYNSWLTEVIHASCKIAQHVFIWGFPEILAHQITAIPQGFKLVSWLTWYYKNCPSVIWGWRSAQNACWHVAAEGSKVYPEHFLSDDQVSRRQDGKMRFVPGPPSVMEVPLNVGFVGKAEQTGHPAQKPLAVIEPLILMSTKEHDTVLDPMCGAGTTGEACRKLNRKGILCDIDPQWMELTSQRLSAATTWFSDGK